MPSQKISAMPDAPTLLGPELVPVVTAGLNYKTTVQLIGGFLFLTMGFRCIPFWNGTKFTSDGALLYTGGGQLQAPSALFQSLVVGGALNATIGNTGIGRFTALHASNGFTGTGPFTNFTIVDGIITAAS
jgi:hypothetical protein